jgi:hypothetical protein
VDPQIIFILDVVVSGWFCYIFLFQGRKKEEEADEEGGREREMSFLSPLFFFVGTVILGSDFVPVLGRRLGLVFSLISSPLLSCQGWGTSAWVW